MTDISRKGFILGSLAVAGGVTGGAAMQGGGFHEPARNLPLTEDADLIVAGGGPAGIAAAITAARMGKRVRLFEAHGALGGLWTVGMISCVNDFGRGTLTKEITHRLEARGARHERFAKPRDDWYVYEPEYMKLVLEDLCKEAGVKFVYHTSVVAAYRDASGRRIETVITESKAGRRAWRAPVFMDCTGDGDLAAFAGCGFDLGGGNGNGDQPASLVGIVHAENDAAIAPFCVNHPGPGPAAFAGGAKGALYRELVAAGVEPSYASPTLFRMQSGLYAFMANHEYGVKLDDSDGITVATVRARRELDALVRALVRRDPTTWKGLRLVVTADQLGHRAARRIHGRYTLTIDDLVAGRRFDDAVSDCALQLDVHGVTQADNRVAGGHTAGRTIKPYQIPLGACRAKDLDNLYMAGRCISGDFLSQASYRVTGPAVEMGEGVVRRIFGV